MAFCSTRSNSNHSVFGDPKELCQNVIPLGVDVFKAYMHHQRKKDNNTVKETCRLVAQQVMDIYIKASIPTIEFDSIVRRVQRLIDKGSELRKYPESKRTSDAYQGNVSRFYELFDVCSCKCYDEGIRNRNSCTCPRENKIPALEWPFWIDQKSDRKMVIGSIDISESRKIVKREKRKVKQLPLCAELELSDMLEDETETAGDRDVGLKDISDEDEYEEEKVSDKDEDEEKNVSDKDKDEEESSYEGSVDNKHFQNRLQYPELCKVLDRTNTSNRDACLIVNALLKDLGILSHSNALDPSKLKRQRKFWREYSVKEYKATIEGVVCLGFDARNDETVVVTNKVKRKIKEEHYVLVSFPTGIYIDHVVPGSKKSADVSKEILSVIKDCNSSSTIRAVVCDGTVLNTGKHNGVIRNLEVSLQRPLQWLICMLHANELPLRKVIQTVCGRTTGPRSCESGLLDMLNYDPAQKPIIQFQSISGHVVQIEDDVLSNLSTDQLYLYRICHLVQNGFNDQRYVAQLQTDQPGSISHARWLTTANRLLRLYVSEKFPSNNLTRLVKFVVNFYAPSWFYIKSNASCQQGSSNFFFMVSLYQKLDPPDQDIVAPVLQNNCYFCHPENLLLAGVGDSDINIRKVASDRIIKARAHLSSISVRCFDKDLISLNLSASSYLDLIDWDTTNVTPPPLLDAVSDEILRKYERVILPMYPCHSQAVERNVKDVTEVCGSHYGHDSRHGAIVQMKKSRTAIPSIETKADFLH